MREVRIMFLQMLRSRTLQFGRCLPYIFLLSLFAMPAFAMQSAEQDLIHGNYQAAITSFNQTLQSNPSDQQAQADLLRAYLETGKYSEAETAAKKFVAKGSSPQVHFYL